MAAGLLPTLGWHRAFEPAMTIALPLVKKAQLTNLPSDGNKLPPAETQGQAEVLSSNW